MVTTEAKSAIRLKFFDMLFGSAKGYVCFATTDPRAPKATFNQRFFEWPKESLKAENWILTVEPNHNVYFCASLLEKQERKKENCLPTNLLWADLDAVNPDTIQPPNIPPPIVFQTSPGRWQALWRMTTIVPAFQAQDYSRRIAYFLAPHGADTSGWDLTQLLRVPLTTNFKYDPPAFIELERCLEATAKPLLFEQLPTDTATDESTPVPNVELKSESIVYKYMSELDSEFIDLMTFEPDEESDYSKLLWGLMHKCYRAGMSQEEVFIVANDSKCNKYARDGRPIEHLWREVLKASESYQFTGDHGELMEVPTLVDSKQSETFLDTYREWATEITDASPEYHDLCILIVLSAIVTPFLRIDSDAGDISPNLYGLLIGESTLTRKTTAMGHALALLREMDPDIVVAADATSEGLLRRLADRPGTSSLFHKDEVSGMFFSMMRKEYMAGFQETLTALYDAGPGFTRLLSKGSYTVDNPNFLMLCGGTPDRIYASTNESSITSGFLPRFLVVRGEPPEKMRRLGPSRETNIAKRAVILNKLSDLYEDYGTQVVQRINGIQMKQSPKYTARLTQEAWDANGDFQEMFINSARQSLVPNLALPTFDRLSRSMLKMSAIFAATKQRPGEFASDKPSIIVDADDVLNAAWYVQRWGKHSVNLAINSGKSADEREVERIHEYVQNKPGVLRSELFKSLHLRAREGEMLMQTLEQRGMIRKEQRGRGFAYWIT